MVIPFELVFLRPKQGEETDLVLNEPMWAEMAERCRKAEMEG